ncbi:MAG TPA: hypothetical protein VIR30_17930, partial [Nocardioides sp.]
LWFVYERDPKHPDSTVHIGVSARSTGESAGTVSLEAAADNEDRTSCGSDSATGDFSQPQLPFGVELAVGTKDYGSRDSACLTSDRIKFSVGPGYSTLDDDLELAIKVVEESSLRDADDPALPAPPEEDAAFVAPKASSPEAVTPGTTFSDAPVLDDGTVSGSVKEGEQVFYRVPLNWGQTLAAQLDAKALPQAVLDQGGPASLSVDIYTPMRRNVDSGFDDTTERGQVGDEALELTTGRGPLLYRNRFENGVTYLPGDYYVAVSAKPNTSREEAAEIPFELTVQAQGEVAGVPEFTEDKGYLIGADQRSSVASGTPRATASEESGWLNGHRVGGLGLGLVGLVLLALGALRLRS